MAEKQTKMFIQGNESEFLRIIRNAIKDGDGDYSYQVSKMASYGLICHYSTIYAYSDLLEWQKEVLQTFLDDLYSMRKPAVICSNIWVRDMGSHFSKRFQSRIAASENTIREITGEDLRHVWSQECKSSFSLDA